MVLMAKSTYVYVHRFTTASGRTGEGGSCALPLQWRQNEEKFLDLLLCQLLQVHDFDNVDPVFPQ